MSSQARAGHGSGSVLATDLAAVAGRSPLELEKPTIKETRMYININRDMHINR